MCPRSLHYAPWAAAAALLPGPSPSTLPCSACGRIRRARPVVGRSPPPARWAPQETGRHTTGNGGRTSPGGALTMALTEGYPSILAASLVYCVCSSTLTVLSCSFARMELWRGAAPAPTLHDARTEHRSTCAG